MKAILIATLLVASISCAAWPTTNTHDDWKMLTGCFDTTPGDVTKIRDLIEAKKADATCSALWTAFLGSAAAQDKSKIVAAEFNTCFVAGNIPDAAQLKHAKDCYAKLLANGLVSSTGATKTFAGFQDPLGLKACIQTASGAAAADTWEKEAVMTAGCSGFNADIANAAKKQADWTTTATTGTQALFESCVDATTVSVPTDKRVAVKQCGTDWKAGVLTTSGTLKGYADLITNTDTAVFGPLKACLGKLTDADKTTFAKVLAQNTGCSKVLAYVHANVATKPTTWAADYASCKAVIPAGTAQTGFENCAKNFDEGKLSTTGDVTGGSTPAPAGTTSTPSGTTATTTSAAYILAVASVVLAFLF